VFDSSSDCCHQARLSRKGKSRKNMEVGGKLLSFSREKKLFSFSESFSGFAYCINAIPSRNPKTSVHNMLGAGVCVMCVSTHFFYK
jgi:hypothetical protein